MTIQEAIYNALAADSDITELVSTRIYQTEREQGEGLPAVVFEDIAGGECLEDMTSGCIGLAKTLFQIDSYSETSKQAAQIREYVRLLFQNHRTAIMGGAGGVHVWACYFEGTSAGFEPGTRTFVRSIDFEFHYQQATS